MRTRSGEMLPPSSSVKVMFSRPSYRYQAEATAGGTSSATDDLRPITRTRGWGAPSTTRVEAPTA